VIVILLDGCAGAFALAGLVLIVLWRLQMAVVMFAVANGSMALSDFATDDRLAACIASGVCAFCVWAWRRSGGGGGTRRRLKALKARFSGKRRTAPVLVGAS
jgi:hypothetical protein